MASSAYTTKATVAVDQTSAAGLSLFDLKREWDTLLSAFNKAWDEREDCDETNALGHRIDDVERQIRAQPIRSFAELALIADVARERLTMDDCMFRLVLDAIDNLARAAQQSRDSATAVAA